VATTPSPHREAFETLGIRTFEELPEDRAEAVGLPRLNVTDLRAPSDEDEDRYWGLICDRSYQSLRALLVRYVTQVLPYPRELQGYWTLSAWPETGGGRRYFTLGVRGTEVFLADQSFGMVLRDRRGLRGRLETYGVKSTAIGPAPYAALRDLKSVRFRCTDDETVRTLLDDPLILDDAYAVCRELMIHGRRGINWKDHNGALSSDVLLTGHRLQN